MLALHLEEAIATGYLDFIDCTIQPNVTDRSLESSALVARSRIRRERLKTGLDLSRVALAEDSPTFSRMVRNFAA